MLNLADLLDEAMRESVDEVDHLGAYAQQCTPDLALPVTHRLRHLLVLVHDPLSEGLRVFEPCQHVLIAVVDVMNLSLVD